MTIEIKDRVDILEHRVDRLESDLVSCGIDKDERITNMHSDMIDLKDTVQNLTAEIREAVSSLKEIARNTMSMNEMVNLYEKWKGFSWVMKSIGFYGAVILAFIIGVIATIIAINGH
jgi:tetrahydromethanopterin S-methyltransferase subunit B